MGGSKSDWSFFHSEVFDQYPPNGKDDYFSWERANIMFYLVYAVPILYPFNENDDEYECKLAVEVYANVLFTKPNTNPLNKKFNSEKKFLKWFNQSYPLKGSVIYYAVKQKGCK